MATDLRDRSTTRPRATLSERVVAITAGYDDAARSAMRAHLTAGQQRYSARLNGQQEDYVFGKTLLSARQCPGP